MIEQKAPKKTERKFKQLKLAFNQLNKENKERLENIIKNLTICSIKLNKNIIQEE